MWTAWCVDSTHHASHKLVNRTRGRKSKTRGTRDTRDTRTSFIAKNGPKGSNIGNELRNRTLVWLYRVGFQESEFYFRPYRLQQRLCAHRPKAQRYNSSSVLRGCCPSVIYCTCFHNRKCIQMQSESVTKSQLTIRISVRFVQLPPGTQYTHTPAPGIRQYITENPTWLDPIAGA